MPPAPERLPLTPAHSAATSVPGLPRIRAELTGFTLPSLHGNGSWNTETPAYDKHTHIHTQTQTHTPTETHRPIHTTDTHTDHTYTETHRDTCIHTTETHTHHTHRDIRHTQRHTYAHTDTHTHRPYTPQTQRPHTHGHTYTHTHHRHTYTHRQTNIGLIDVAQMEEMLKM